MNYKDKINSIREKLNQGKASIGSWVQIPHPDIVQIICNNNFDWITVDLEHGSGSIVDIPNVGRIINNSNSAFLIRIEEGNFKNIQRFLDFGVNGIIFSKVEDAKKFKQILKKIYYPPIGTRGYGYCIENNYGKKKVSLKDLEFKPLSIAMIETANGLKNLDIISKIKSLDAIFIGPYDLSISLGIPGQFNNEKFINALKKIVLTCKKNNKPLGIHIVEPNLKELKKRIEQGFKFIAYSMDTVCLNHNLKKPI
ncbi:aldolase/citrate lyase family protein [Candidatus Pelagibacter sp.]|nr:aldolase/citrate lyase family protein [Candidatus Pelagibacter sp.]